MCEAQARVQSAGKPSGRTNPSWDSKRGESMGKTKAVILSAASLFILADWGCSKRSEEVTELKHYPVTSLEQVITRSGVEIDKEITNDGNGALRITADQPVTVRLYETGDLDVEVARLIYMAKLRTENVDGQVYLEMWCSFPGKGEFFSRALQSPLSGSTDWTTQETPFFLQKGENPDNVKLNLVIDGKGTVWVDDIRLVKGPLR
jgi:hypothetical protein